MHTKHAHAWALGIINNTHRLVSWVICIRHHWTDIIPILTNVNVLSGFSTTYSHFSSLHGLLHCDKDKDAACCPEWRICRAQFLQLTWALGEFYVNMSSGGHCKISNEYLTRESCSRGRSTTVTNHSIKVWRNFLWAYPRAEFNSVPLKTSFKRKPSEITHRHHHHDLKQRTTCLLGVAYDS